MGRCAFTSARKDSTSWIRLRRLYRIVPKRALGHRLEDFGRLVQAALPPFDYRRRFPVANAARI
jgi:hypothetical protein